MSDKQVKIIEKAILMSIANLAFEDDFVLDEELTKRTVQKVKIKVERTVENGQ